MTRCEILTFSENAGSLQLYLPKVLSTDSSFGIDASTPVLVHTTAHGGLHIIPVAKLRGAFPLRLQRPPATALTDAGDRYDGGSIPPPSALLDDDMADQAVPGDPQPPPADPAHPDADTDD